MFPICYNCTYLLNRKTVKFGDNKKDFFLTEFLFPFRIRVILKVVTYEKTISRISLSFKNFFRENVEWDEKASRTLSQSKNRLTSLL